MSRLQNKIALVTAAGQGIGRASAELFAKEGARVIAVDINSATLATLTGMETHRVDLTDGAAIEALSRDVGGVDVLFNCAGFVHAGTLLTTTDADFDFSFNLNVKSAFRMIRAAGPLQPTAGVSMRRRHSRGPGRFRGSKRMDSGSRPLPRSSTTSSSPGRTLRPLTISLASSMMLQAA